MNNNVTNTNLSGNLQRSKFYVCPVCGNVIWSTGEGVFSCCGVTLTPLEVEGTKVEGKNAKVEGKDDAAAKEILNTHEIHVERVENEWYVTLDHPMTKDHYITFLAFVTGDRVQIVRLYPEQNCETRFFTRGKGYLYAYCNRHGLFRVRV